VALSNRVYHALYPDKIPSAIRLAGSWDFIYLTIKLRGIAKYREIICFQFLQKDI
jgi:hypothetical protein